MATVDSGQKNSRRLKQVRTTEILILFKSPFYRTLLKKKELARDLTEELYTIDKICSQRITTTLVYTKIVDSVEGAL